MDDSESGPPRKGLKTIDLGSMLAGRCPRCHKGRIFAPLFGSSPLKMHTACSDCGLVFDREPGYFVGAMYFSYTFGVATVVPLALILLLVFHVSAVVVIVIALLQTLATMVFSFRYARVAWLYLDQALDPR